MSGQEHLRRNWRRLARQDWHPLVHLWWEFIKENKKTRFRPRKLPRKREREKKNENTLSTKRFLGRERAFFIFSYFLDFFYEFPPLQCGDTLNIKWMSIDYSIIVTKWLECKGVHKRLRQLSVLSVFWLEVVYLIWTIS